MNKRKHEDLSGDLSTEKAGWGYTMPITPGLCEAGTGGSLGLAGHQPSSRLNERTLFQGNKVENEREGHPMSSPASEHVYIYTHMPIHYMLALTYLHIHGRGEAEPGGKYAHRCMKDWLMSLWRSRTTYYLQTRCLGEQEV